MMPLVSADAAEHGRHDFPQALQNLHEMAVLVEQDSGDARLEIALVEFREHVAQIRLVEQFGRGAGVGQLEQVVHNLCVFRRLHR